MTENFILTEFTDLFLLRFPWLGGIWLTCVGGCLGSFLNVVVYRMPAGLNIAHPPSRCPQCETPIRGRDNIPVVSWFLLKGRCRACGLGIAARYPKVEAFVAAVFALMALASVIAADANPERANQFALTFFYLGALQFVLIGMFLIHFDQNKIPKSLVIFFVCFAILFPIGANFLVESWNSFGEHYVVKVFANLVGATLVGVALARFCTQGHNFVLIALVAASFRGIGPVMYAGLISAAIGFLCKKICWFFPFLFSTLMGLDAAYYILKESSLIEFVPKRIATPLCLILIILYVLSSLIVFVRVRPRTEKNQ